MSVKTVLIEGRTLCPVCDTDKLWRQKLDAKYNSIEFEMNDFTTQQNKIQVDPGHIGHIDKLTKTVRIV
jgi:hypothetical protein